MMKVRKERIHENRYQRQFIEFALNKRVLRSLASLQR